MIAYYWSALGIKYPVWLINLQRPIAPAITYMRYLLFANYTLLDKYEFLRMRERIILRSTTLGRIKLQTIYLLSFIIAVKVLAIYITARIL